MNSEGIYMDSLSVRAGKMVMFEIGSSAVDKDNKILPICKLMMPEYDVVIPKVAVSDSHIDGVSRVALIGSQNYKCVDLDGKKFFKTGYNIEEDLRDYYQTQQGFKELEPVEDKSSDFVLE